MMDITKATEKFLYSICKSFIKHNGITYSESNSYFFKDDDFSDYGEKIYNFLKERNLYERGSDKFLFMFIKINKDVLFSDEKIYDYSSLKKPKLNKYEVVFDVTETQRIAVMYQHKITSWIDDEKEFANEITKYRDEGVIYPDEGKVTSEEVIERFIDDELIHRIRKIS